MIQMQAMSRGRARQLAGRMLLLPATNRRLELRLKIIRVEVDPGNPGRVLVHGIIIDRVGREREGRTLILSPTGIDCYLQ